MESSVRYNSKHGLRKLNITIGNSNYYIRYYGYVVDNRL